MMKNKIALIFLLALSISCFKQSQHVLSSLLIGAFCQSSGTGCFSGFTKNMYRTELPYADHSLQQWDSITKKGKLNQQRKENVIKSINSIIEKYGFPTMQMVGKFAVYQSYDILDYTNLLTKQYPEIQKAYLKKGIEPELYAQITDKYLLLKGEKQMYGTIFRSGGTKYDKRYPGAFILSPVKNFKELNKRRLEMGMSTIEEYIEQNKNMNFVIPKEYYK